MRPWEPHHRNLRLLTLVASAVVATTAAADSPAPLTTYLRPEYFNAMVIDNERGWIDFVDPVQHDADIERNPIFKVRNRSGIKLEGTDCSTEDIRCVELHMHRGITLLAFRRGVAGDTYAVRDVKFEIRSVGTFPASPERKVYWVKFVAAAPHRSGDFIYIDQVGVVRFASAFETELRQPGGGKFLSSFHLTDGPGLLAPGGFPKQR